MSSNGGGKPTAIFLLFVSIKDMASQALQKSALT
jgi:hypothetical protein